MHVEYFPRNQLVDRLQQGWRLIPRHTYRTDEWAILMMLPAAPVPACELVVRAALQTFGPKPKRPAMSNLSAATLHRNLSRWSTSRRLEAQA